MLNNATGQCPECGSEFCIDQFEQRLKDNTLNQKKFDRYLFLPSLIIFAAVILLCPMGTSLKNNHTLEITFLIIALLSVALVCSTQIPKIWRNSVLKSALAAEDASKYVSRISYRAMIDVLGWVFGVLLISAIAFYAAIIAFPFLSLFAAAMQLL